MISKRKILAALFIVLGTVFSLSRFNFGNEREEMVLQISAAKNNEVDVINTSAYKQEYEVIETSIADSSKLGIEMLDYDGNGISWMISKVSDAKNAIERKKYINTYNQFGERIAQTFVPGSTQLVEGQAAVYKYGGYVSPGNYFYPGQLTRYGFDCAGCSVRGDGYSRTAMGIDIGNNRVRQSDGSWREGLTYDGYYIIAMGPEVPLGTIVEISNHGFSGGGLTPGVPFKAIVGDRGVFGSAVDLYVGSEKNLSNVVQSYSAGTKVTIIH